MPTNHHSPLLFPIFSTCPLDRLQRAVEALTAGTYTLTLTHVSEAALRALVTNGDGKEYGVCLTATLATCSCRDFSYRGGICKHQILTALHAIRTPSPQPEVEAPALPVPVDVAPVVVSPRPCLVWRDGLTVCSESHPHGVRMWPWTAPTLEAACQDCKSVFANGYQKHMIHLMSHKHAA